MKNEKATLISIFGAFFVLGSILMYAMLKKDQAVSDISRNIFQNRNEDSQNAQEIWPKVEIQTRTN